MVTYVDAHDNETLFDSLTLKLPVATTMADRVRMNTLSLSTTALSQGPMLWHAGADLLRSKSLDRNCYDSGDWFNRIDWTGQQNTFGSGLPPAPDNEAKWPFMAPLLADPALKPAPADMAAATAGAQDLLRLRFSSPLFRLGSAELIEQKVSFPTRRARPAGRRHRDGHRRHRRARTSIPTGTGSSWCSTPRRPSSSVAARRHRRAWP